MPINNQQANDPKWMDTITMITEATQNVSVKNVADVSKFISGSQYDGFALLKGMTEDIDKPILKSLANDMIGVLGSLYIDEDSLCCLIKNLLMTAGAGISFEEYRTFIKKLQKERGFKQSTFEDIIFEIKELNFVKFIDYMIATIDITLVFLEFEINDIVFPAMDFIREISEAAAGFVLIAMQEIIFTVRDSAIAWIIDEIENNTNDVNWAKCLPYMDFISIIKKYISDYGILNKLMAMFQGAIGDSFRKWSKARRADLPKKVKLISFLRWIREILVKIRDAVLSWEFCLFIVKQENNDGDNQEDDSNPYFNYLSDILNNPTPTSDHLRPDYIFADDNTILNNEGGVANGDGSKGQNSITTPANDEVKAFLQNYLGLSPDKADQALADANKNTGNDVNGNNNNGQCSNVLNPKDINDILERFIEQSRVG